MLRTFPFWPVTSTFSATSAKICSSKGTTGCAHCSAKAKLRSQLRTLARDLGRNLGQDIDDARAGLRHWAEPDRSGDMAAGGLAGVATRINHLCDGEGCDTILYALYTWNND